MNKNLYRIVFNVLRNSRMAVQETAASAGKASGATPAVVAAALALFTSLPGSAQIVGAPGAGPLRPTVLAAPNGVPLVNITTPSAAGVSRNIYSQFDVQRNGVILNNSRTAAQTQLGGMVQGNPWLARGPARVILNEVNSGNPTHLRGPIEIGGRRAEVIVANPAGISVDGTSFINASRATLTTGVAQFNAAGGLDSFVVREGKVSIEGLGLDANTTDSAAILARAVQVNAGIWANELKVVTGANQVSADHDQVTPTAGTGARPAFSLDVAHLGGMYAGKIRLVGSEAGLGVRNAGSIGMGAGELVVTAEGKIENRGTFEARRLALASQGDIDNRGGTIRQTGDAGLTLAAPVLSNADGGVIGAEPAPRVSAQAGAGGAPAAPSAGAAAAGGGETAVASGPASTTQPQPQVPSAPGTVTAMGAILNDGGRVHAQGAIALQTPQINNAGGSLSVAQMAVSGAAFSNAGGTLNVAGAFSANVGRFDNSAGTVRAGGLNITTSGDLVNEGGTLTSETDAALTVGGAMNNTRGSVSAAGALAADVAGALNNTAGFISATGDLAARMQGFTNAAGGIVLGQAQVALDTHGAAYDNRGGRTLALGDLRIDAGTVRNTGGLIRSMATTTVHAAAVDNSLASGAEQGIEGRNVAVTAAALNNTQGAIRADENVAIASTGSVDNSAGLISARGALSIVDPHAAHAPNGSAKTLSVLNTGGTLLADKALVIDADRLALDGNLLSGGDLHVALNQDVAIAAGSQTIANGNLGIATSGDITHSGKLAAGNALRLSARNIDNTATGDIQAKATTLEASETVTNRGIIDGITTRIGAKTLKNIGTGRIYGDHVSIGVDTLDNLAETVGGVTASVTTAATIAARERLDIGATTVNNRDGALIFSDGDLAIDTATLNNHAATIEATRNADIRAAVLNNTNGGVTWTLAPGPNDPSGQNAVVEYAPPGSTARYKASDAFFVQGGLGGWEAFSGIAATDPALVGGDPNLRLMVASPAYPVERFRSYYLRSPRNSVDFSYSYSVGGEGDSTVTAKMPGAWYAGSDPIWAAFGVAPPVADLPASHPGRIDANIVVGQPGIRLSVDGPGDVLVPFSHPVTQAEHAEWQAYRKAHAALDTATMEFITTMTGKWAWDTPAKPSRIHTTWDYWKYTQTSATPVLQSSAPGRILSGGAMRLAVGSGTNDMSQIAAGGALSVTGGSIRNIDQQVDAQSVRSGVAGHTYVQRRTFGSDRRHHQAAPYDLVNSTTVTLAAAQQAGNVALAGSGATGTLGTPSPGQTAAAAQGGSRVNPIVQIVQVPSATAGAPLTVRTSAPDAAVPTASLFGTRPESSVRYLVETDARFTNRRTWLSSDYLLDNLGQDPRTTLKRLGDGFYEQRLIREQVAKLTGYRHLAGYTSDEDQYVALMNAGVSFAQRFQLTPGVALSATQMAQLTSDIVWLVEQDVTLPDGSTHRVLAPQVYVRVKEGDIDGSGALLSGRHVNMALEGDLTAQGGTIAGREAVAISAENIKMLAGRIAGNDVSVLARNDIDLIGARIDAGDSLSAIAGRDINVVTTTRESQSSESGVKLGATVVDRLAGLYVTHPGGSLLAVAGRDLNLVGAQVRSTGDAKLGAGRDLNLDSVATGQREDIRWSHKNSRRSERVDEVGSTVTGSGDVSLHAQRDLTARAAALRAGTDGDAATLRLDAGRNLTLYAGQHADSAQTRHANRRGLERASLDAESLHTGLERTTLDAGPAGSVELRSGGDMTLAATQVKAQRLDIDAGGRLNLLTQSTRDSAGSRRSSSDVMFQSMAGKGHDDQTTHYNQFDVARLGVKAAGGVTAQVSERDSLAALGQRPGMGWVHQLMADPALAHSTAWRTVQEEHTKWTYAQSGLSPTGAAIVTLIVGALTAGAGSAWMGTAAAPATGTTAAVAGTGLAGSLGLSAAATTLAAGAMQAGITAIASQATVSLVNNNGDIGKVLKELGSSQSIRNIATAMATGGALAGLNVAGVLPAHLAGATNGSAQFMDQLQRQLIDGAATAVVRSAINGTRLEDELKYAVMSAMLNTLAAQGADTIGDLSLDGFTNKIAHAMAGCAVGAARASSGNGCAPGALGAVIGEISGEMFGFDENGNPNRYTVDVAAMLGGVGGAIAGLDADQMNIAARAAANAAENNALKHYAERALAKLSDGLKALELKPLLEKQQLIREYLDKAGARGGLTDLELSTLGVIYAANETLFPTSVLDAFPGAGKAISKTGTLIKGGAKAEDAARAVATESKVANGTANTATSQRLKDQLASQNLANIAAQDSRLAAAVGGSGRANPNFSVGTGTTAEAHQLGQTWVGDGARLVSNQNACPGCLISADGTRIYRPPQPKDSPYATTGIQANLVRQTSNGMVISNGHLDVTP